VPNTAGIGFNEKDIDTFVEEHFEWHNGIELRFNSKTKIDFEVIILLPEKSTRTLTPLRMGSKSPFIHTDL
jgi:hypothetical protein